MNEQIIEFLTELRSHNNREWFQDNKIVTMRYVRGLSMRYKI